MNHTERNPLGLYTIGIVALFLAGFFLLVVFGARSFRDTVNGQYHNMDTRGILSYLSTTVKSCDTADAVRVENGENGQVLVVADGDSGYGFRIYLREGDLVEDYASLSSPFMPEEAQVIGEATLFQVEQPEDDVLVVHTDAGRLLLKLRSEGGV